jgi:hypothetical protein
MLEAAFLPEDFMDTQEDCFQVLSMDEETLLGLHDADKYPAWVACAKLIRRELVESYPFREGRVFEDNEAVCHWVCEGKRLATMEHRLYFYRTNQGSTTKSQFSLKKLDYLWALESIIGFYTELGYLQMRKRFADRYMDAAINCCSGARYLLNRPDVVREIEKQTKRFLRREGISMSKEQFEAFLDVTHPKIIKLYWPLSGVVSTLREDGFSGIFRKIQNRVGKGEDK